MALRPAVLLLRRLPALATHPVPAHAFTGTRAARHPFMEGTSTRVVTPGRLDWLPGRAEQLSSAVRVGDGSKLILRSLMLPKSAFHVLHVHEPSTPDPEHLDGRSRRIPLPELTLDAERDATAFLRRPTPPLVRVRSRSRQRAVPLYGVPQRHHSVAREAARGTRQPRRERSRSAHVVWHAGAHQRQPFTSA